MIRVRLNQLCAELLSRAVVAYRWTFYPDYRKLTVKEKWLVRKMWKLWFWTHLARM